jgi:uncharacterized membrane protein YeaQ/YmgE (transglycosylase-associated protein family)
VPSHALPHGPEARIRRRSRRRESLGRLRDWRHWGRSFALGLFYLLLFQLSGWMTGRFWPKAHGAGYFITQIVVRGVLLGVIGAVLGVAVMSLAGIVRRLRSQP